ncbi:MAG: thioredoxin domain-containing protein [Candidatus Dadabacteria bacterium]|nr:thioredoxin domain-containing protein [Candidatus Dadabacteria bacterium]NIQ13696.1 thioredoxin domain-containing protein [Candidatus Dadabacteria bacterium]
MRETLIILIVLLVVSLGLNAWTLSKVSKLSDMIEKQSKTLTAMTKDLSGSKKARSKPAAPTEVKVSIDDDPVKGDKNAPITIVEFSDYQCPYCRKFHTQVLPKIEEEYINTGKVRYIFRDFPLGFHKLAIPASVAANCAGEQGKYWVLNDFLFDNPSKLDNESVLEAAKSLDLDYNKFEACLKDNNHEKEINKDLSDGKSYGVRGTPSIFLGKSGKGKEFTGLYLRGFRPFEFYKAEIDKLLASK